MLNIRHTGIYVEDIAKQAEFYKNNMRKLSRFRFAV